MHVHPGSGKYTLLSMLSVGLYTTTKLRINACASRKRKIYFTFYAFSRSYSIKVTRLCMCIQETENLLYFFYFEYACSNKITHKCASRKWRTHTTFHSFSTSIQQDNYTSMCSQKRKSCVTLHILLIGLLYSNKITFKCTSIKQKSHLECICIGQAFYLLRLENATSMLQSKLSRHKM